MPTDTVHAATGPLTPLDIPRVCFDAVHAADVDWLKEAWVQWLEVADEQGFNIETLLLSAGDPARSIAARVQHSGVTYDLRVGRLGNGQFTVRAVVPPCPEYGIGDHDCVEHESSR
jgi:hypothetical protein